MEHLALVSPSSGGVVRMNTSSENGEKETGLRNIWDTMSARLVTDWLRIESRKMPTLTR